MSIGAIRHAYSGQKITRNICVIPGTWVVKVRERTYTFSTHLKQLSDSLSVYAVYSSLIYLMIVVRNHDSFYADKIARKLLFRHNGSDVKGTPRRYCDVPSWRI